MLVAEVLDPYNLMGSNTKMLRQSTLGTSDVCLKRLGYDLDPTMPRGTGEARIVGTAYHAGQESHYEGVQLWGLPPSLRDTLLAAERNFAEQTEGFDAWDTSRDEALTKVKSMLTAYFEGGHEWDSTYKVVGVEQEWFAPLNDEWAVKGTIDLVLNGPQGVVLVDHKTAGRKWPQGKESPRKNQQAVLYCWAWWRCTGELPYGFAFDVMTYKGEFERRWSFPTPEAMAAVLAKAMGVGAILDAVPRDMLPANTSSALCSSRYCDFWLACPHGAALDQAA